MSRETIAPGARVRIRDAEWLVQRVDQTSDGGQVLDVVGLSELVEDQEARFVRELEEDTLELIDPAETALRQDESPGFRQSRLYMESLLRKRSPTDEDLHVGHRAAIDPVPYQWKPALQAPEQPRQRILIADATGLGKTMEAGILMSELIERGQGKRILVVALKSMMTQLQKELWSRFAIPLVRLDSRGIQRTGSGFRRATIRSTTTTRQLSPSTPSSVGPSTAPLSRMRSGTSSWSTRRRTRQSGASRRPSATASPGSSREAATR